MTNASTDALLGAAAKALAWELFAAAGYARVRAPVNVDRFGRELLSAAAKWKAIRDNLEIPTTERRIKHGTSNQ